MRYQISFYRLLATMGCAMLLSTCTTADTHGELIVAAARSLTGVFQELVPLFEAEHSILVVPSFSATGQLAQQIRNGAPYDVFVAADEVHIDSLIDEGYLDEQSRIIYAQGELVVIGPADTSLELESLAGLALVDLERIAIANPEHAPYGIAAREALISAGIWSEVRSKIIYGETVRQAAVIVATGNADVAIIARSAVDPEVKVLLQVGSELHQPILHAAARLSSTTKADWALTFLNFLRSAEGQTILESNGLSLP